MKISNNLTNFLIRNGIILDEDREIYDYGFFVLLYNSFLVINILLLGFIFNEVGYAVLFLVFWTPYRIFIGGSHCSTVFRCWIFFDIYFLIGYYIYLSCSNMNLLILNSFFMFIQLFKKKNLSVFFILWFIYYILLFILPASYHYVMSISYMMNSVLVLHSIITNNKFIV